MRHGNAAGVLVIGLGCENNQIDSFKKAIGDYNPNRVKFLKSQEVEDELEEGVKLIGELVEYAERFKRQELPLSKLRIGLKCGGSDGFSGITANPLVGRIADAITSAGGTALLTEVPEMFGAETILMDRRQMSRYLTGSLTWLMISKPISFGMVRKSMRILHRVIRMAASQHWRRSRLAVRKRVDTQP